MSKRYFLSNPFQSTNFDERNENYSTPIADRFRTIAQSLQSASTSLEHHNRSSMIDSQISSSPRIDLHRHARKDPSKNLHQKIRENVISFKEQLIRNESDYQSSSSRQINFDENSSECSIDRDLIPSRTSSSTDLQHWKKLFDQSERERLQIFDQYQNLTKKFEEKEKLIVRYSNEIQELNEQSDTLERQNGKLQQDLKLALEKLEEMTNEAERFAEESQLTQKHLADAEQKFEEFQIQMKENLKQSTMKVKKLEKDLERQKDEGMKLVEKNEELTRENQTLQTQNLNLREKITEIESEFNQNKIDFQQLEEQSQRNENELIQLRSIRSTQESDVKKLRFTLNEFENQLNLSRQRCAQFDREKIHYQHLFDRETKQREMFEKKSEELHIELENLKKSFEEIQHDREDLTRKVQELERERDFLTSNYSQIKTTLIQLEEDYDAVKNQFERCQIDSKRHLDALHSEQENQLEKIHFQLNEERTRTQLLQKHQIELKRDLEKFQEKSFHDDQQITEKKLIIERLEEENEKNNHLIKELQTKTNQSNVELTNLKARYAKRTRESQSFFQTIFNDLNYCLQCLTKSSDRPFTLDTPPSHENDDEYENDYWSSRIKILLNWFKEEVQRREEHENQLRRDFENLLLDSEADRKYFVTEIAKREILLNDRHNSEQKDLFHRLKLFSSQLLSVEPERLSSTSNSSFNQRIDFDEERILIRDDKDRLNERFEHYGIWFFPSSDLLQSIARFLFVKTNPIWFQTMIDLVKQDLHTAKIQLSN